jgi:hypothetical protein
MIPGRRLHRYTYADYVALELESPTKHEFLGGEIYAMADGTVHARHEDGTWTVRSAITGGTRCCRKPGRRAAGRRDLSRQRDQPRAAKRRLGSHGGHAPR